MKRGRNQRRRQGMNINRAFDSNGPDVRIRGTANQIYDKYLALARDASSAGDRVKAENYLQHAEHYFRVLRAMQPSAPTPADQPEDDGEQPTIGEPQERQRPAPHRQNEPAAANAEKSAGSGSGNGEAPSEGSRETAAEDGEAAARQNGESETRRRRRRPRRQGAAGAEESEAGEREEEAAPAAAS
ncbi:DUF4167 domain-containing protein [Amphiplicatus metriothermophilus]|uniref:DUF4167 domain-containing protein n=1 Tax=Amphiplicatus metriothermophilus TaxID=1519374 RepID=A0A239PSV3_9PROT|nr:DUF4167 domain-containing protein [Amphiplicatus metriothermophilus]MBB5519148.1 hypothetical protein [Amphiplicatus metriothermophilus]SNT73218.1 protein of unknown function [Amphiplicatus metriothermophilus]